MANEIDVAALITGGMGVLGLAVQWGINLAARREHDKRLDKQDVECARDRDEIMRLKTLRETDAEIIRDVRRSLEEHARERAAGQEKHMHVLGEVLARLERVASTVEHLSEKIESVQRSVDSSPPIANERAHR